MSINVYWSFLHNEWMRAEKPEPVMRTATKKFKADSSNGSIEKMFRCPSVSEEMKNLFLVRSIYDYDLHISSEKVVNSTMYDQRFFDEHVNVRDSNAKFISFEQPFIFFTDAKSLEITWSIPPYLEDNDFINSAYTFPGRFDIGKWFRPVDSAIIFKKGVASLTINEGDAFSYLKFHTDEKINFIKFAPTEKIKFFSSACIKSTIGREAKARKLQAYYQMFTLKKQILAEIKQNLL